MHAQYNHNTIIIPNHSKKFHKMKNIKVLDIFMQLEVHRSSTKDHHEYVVYHYILRTNPLIFLQIYITILKPNGKYIYNLNFFFLIVQSSRQTQLGSKFNGRTNLK